MARAGNLSASCITNNRHRFLLTLLFILAPLFAQEAPDLVTLELPVRVNGVIKGLVTARIDQRTETLYDIDEEVLALLDDYDAGKTPLPPGPVPDDKDAGIHAEQLAAVGITARFDAYHVEVSITIDPASLRVRRHSLSGTANASGATLKEESVGGGLNLYSSGSLDLSSPASGGRTEAWTSFGLKYDAFLGIQGWVLESDGGLSLDAAASRFAFGGAVLTHDFASRFLRFQVGTVAYPVLANQIRLPIYGATLYMDPSFDPTYRANSYDASFFLAKSSEVEIMRNGRKVWSDTLPAGPHLVTDIPIDNGTNRIEVLVDGNPSVVDIPFESSLIRSGEWRWGASAGVLKSEPTLPVVSGFGRHGFSPSITGGAFLHADLNTQALGSDFVFALPVGGLDAALTANHSWTLDIGHQWGAMGHVGYRLQT
jgi:outer membrane usher protein FimD/PapC